MITVYELMYMFLENDFQRFALYDLSKDETIFNGFLRDLPFKYEHVEVQSIDKITGKTITLNVDITEE